MYPKNFHDSSDICPMGLMYSIKICQISHRTFGPSHRKCPTCPMIFVNTAIIKWGIKLFIHSQTSSVQPLKVWGGINNFIPHSAGHVIIYPGWNSSQSMLVKGVPVYYFFCVLWHWSINHYLSGLCVTGIRSNPAISPSAGAAALKDWLIGFNVIANTEKPSNPEENG